MWHSRLRHAVLACTKTATYEMRHPPALACYSTTLSHVCLRHMNVIFACSLVQCSCLFRRSASPGCMPMAALSPLVSRP